MVNKINQNRYIPGFSLLEACITMLIAAIFIAMCANAYTKRNVTYQESDGHGRYECYKVGGGVAQRYVENNSARDISGSTCIFRPPRYAKYILINATGGGSSGGSLSGEFISSFFSSIDEPLTIQPGGVAGVTRVYKNNQEIVSAAGSSSDMVVISSTVDKVKNCTVGDGIKASSADPTTSPPFDCGIEPFCAQDGSNIRVRYCRTKTDYEEMSIPIADLKANRISYSGSKISYQDIQDYVNKGGFTAAQAVSMIRNNNRAYNSYFTLDVEFDVTLTEESLMENYLKILGVTGGIADINPGAPNSAGGVVILW